MVIDPHGRTFLSNDGDTMQFFNTSLRGICYNGHTTFPPEVKPPESFVNCRYYADSPIGDLRRDRHSAKPGT